MFDKYKPVELLDQVSPGSQKSRAPADSRLGAEEKVLGVALEGAARAYPFGELEKAGILQDRIADKPAVILWYGPTRTAAAYLSIANPPTNPGPMPRTITLAQDRGNPATPFVDKETGSRWDIAGRAMEGELKGWTLAWLDGVQVRWFAWAAEHPQTSIHGK
jgi:hypothetical protein